MSEFDDVLQEFLKEQLPSGLMEALEALARLNYPIYDRKSLRRQLEQIQTAGDQGHEDKQSSAQATLIDDVLGTFRAADFGLDTLQSALEKFMARRSRIAFSPVIPWPRNWDWDFTLPEEPAIDFPIGAHFEDDVCGRAAAQLWREHLDDPLTAILGPSPAERDWLQERAARCRRGSLPTFSRNPGCEEIAQLAYARCRILGGAPRTCMAEARETMSRSRC